MQSYGQIDPMISCVKGVIYFASMRAFIRVVFFLIEDVEIRHKIFAVYTNPLKILYERKNNQYLEYYYSISLHI